MGNKSSKSKKKEKIEGNEKTKYELNTSVVNTNVENTVNTTDTINTTNVTVAPNQINWKNVLIKQKIYKDKQDQERLRLIGEISKFVAANPQTRRGYMLFNSKLLNKEEIIETIKSLGIEYVGYADYYPHDHYYQIDWLEVNKKVEAEMQTEEGVNDPILQMLFKTK